MYIREEQEYHQKLYTSDYDLHRNRIARPANGTCSWILTHTAYSAWITCQSSSLLWISADPGCGKTVLASYLLETLSQSQKSDAVCFFFLKDGSPEQRSLTCAMSAILHELVSHKRSLVKYVISGCNGKGSNALRQFYVLWNMLTTAALDNQAGRIRCIIDGLDESLENERNDFMNSIFDFFNTTEEQYASLQFIITSRPYRSIERDFARWHRFERIQLRAEDEPIFVQRDIKLLVQARVAELTTLKKISRQVAKDLVEVLTRNAGLNFLWVTLVLDLIQKTPQVSKRAMKRLLESRPDRPDDIYEQILSKSPNVKEAKRLLHIVIGARRPLTLDEINIAFIIREDDRYGEDLAEALEPQIGNTIRELCGLFV